MAYNPFKSLAYYFDSYFSGLAKTTGFIGNLLQVPIVSTVPRGTPPGNVGVQIYVDPNTHVVSFYVWDGVSQWIQK